MGHSIKKILLVDDEPDLLSTIKFILETNGFEVACSNDGESAKKIIKDENVDLIISDFQMPMVTGIDLFEWVRENNISTPFVIMTGFSKINSTFDSIENGLNGFLSKPFSLPELMDLIQDIQNEIADPTEVIDNEYSEVKLSHFMNDFFLPTNVYLKMNQSKVIKVAHAGERIDKNRIERYKTQNVNSLLIKTKDYQNFLLFQLKVAKSYIESTDESTFLKKKHRLICNLREDITKFSFDQGLKQDLYDLSKETICLAIENHLDSENGLIILENLMENGNSIYTHSISVSLFSVAVAKQLGFSDQSILVEIALAGLFHDIGKSEILDEILKTPNYSLSDEQRKILGGHPALGMKILSSLPDVSPTVCDIVLHHEDVFGTSQYSERLPNLKMAHIVATTNLFCNIWKNQSQNASQLNDVFKRLQQPDSHVRKEVQVALKYIFDAQSDKENLLNKAS